MEYSCCPQTRWDQYPISQHCENAEIMSLEQVSKHNLGEAVAGRRRENMGELGLKPCCKAQANSSASHLVPDTPEANYVQEVPWLFLEKQICIYFFRFSGNAPMWKRPKF